MMHTTSLLAALISLALTQSGAAAPTTAANQNHAEIIPGPGMPSLAELNVTSAQLYALGRPAAQHNETTSKFHALFDANCGPSEAAYGNVNEIIGCYNYLMAVGYNTCQAPDGHRIVEMCRAGGSHVTGQSLLAGTTSSLCRDVASAVLYTVDHCTRPDQSVAGFQAAYNNGDLIIGAVNAYY